MPAGVRMDRYRENGVVVFVVDPVELVQPDLLEIARIDKSVTVWRSLVKNEGGPIFEEPARRHLDEIRLPAVDERFHPRLRRLGEVNPRPCVTPANVVAMEVG